MICWNAFDYLDRHAYHIDSVQDIDIPICLFHGCSVNLHEIETNELRNDAGQSRDDWPQRFFWMGESCPNSEHYEQKTN